MAGKFGETGGVPEMHRPKAEITELNENSSRFQQEIVETEFDDNIIISAKGILHAVHTLMRSASNAQRELAMQGRAAAGGTGTYQWSEGLISAARVVVASVHKLCDAANTLMKGQTTEERLISAAKQVSSSTAQLLVACNVRADPDSQANRRLQAAGQAVRVSWGKIDNLRI